MAKDLTEVGSEELEAEIPDAAYVRAAKANYTDEGSVEVDEGAAVSRGTDAGAYVAAWVWVTNEAAADHQEEEA